MFEILRVNCTWICSSSHIEDKSGLSKKKKNKQRYQENRKSRKHEAHRKKS